MSTTNEAYLPLLNSIQQIFTPNAEQPQIPAHLDEPMKKDWEGYFKLETDGDMTITVGADDLACVTLSKYPNSPINLTAQEGDPNGGGVYREISHTFPGAKAGYYYASVSYTNVSGPAENIAHLEVKVNNKSMELGTVVEKKLRKLSIGLSKSEDSVSESDLGKENPSRCASGYIFKGVMVGTFTEDGKSEEITKSYGLVQTGGWMAEDSPWTNNLVNDPANPQSKISVPSSVPFGDRYLWPDTCCPSTVTGVHTFLHTGNVVGFQIDSPYEVASGDPNRMRRGLKIHMAGRTGSEGCISVLDESVWNELCQDMERINANPAVPALNIQYNGEAPNPYRHN